MFSSNSELKFNLVLENCTNSLYCKFHVVVGLHHIIDDVDLLTFHYLSAHCERNYQLYLPNNGIVYFQWYSPSTCCLWSINDVKLYINGDTITTNLTMKEIYFFYSRINGLQSLRYNLTGHNRNSVLVTKSSVMTTDATCSGMTSFTGTVITSSSTITRMTSSAIKDSETYNSHLIIIPTETISIDIKTIRTTKTSKNGLTSIETSSFSITSITSMTSVTERRITSMISTNIISSPSPSPKTCSTDGIWPETLQGHNVTGFYCYKGTVNGK